MEQNEKKNDMKKKRQVQGGWAIALFQFALGHDTGNCIVTQSWGGWPGRATRPRHGRAGAQQDATTRPGEAYDTAGRT